MRYGTFPRAKLRLVKLQRPSGLTLLAAALLLLMPVVALFQFKWIGQVSASEQERLERNVETAAEQFRRAFDFEVFGAWNTLWVSPITSRDEAWHRFLGTRDDWASNTTRPELVKNIYFIDASPDGTLRLRVWDNNLVTFKTVAWPDVLVPWRADFEQALIDFRSGVAGRQTRETQFAVQDALTIRAQPPLVERRSAANSASQYFSQQLVFGYTVLEMNLPYIQQQLLPDLAQRHFIHEGNDSYRVAVLDADTSSVIYRSDEDAPLDPAKADVVQGFFSNRFSRTQQPRVEPQPIGRPDAAQNFPRRQEEFAGRWKLLVQHQSGSLEAAISAARTRNLALSFGVLLLLTVSIGLLAISSRRAQRLARQQMEFVASVSHELRTPVAVIKSAAENLSQGVVGNADRVKRYGQMIEGEARRLGEMVERVLQYAGIDSGLGYGTRAPLAPQEIVESAIGNVLPMLGPDKITIERQIPEGLPPVLGDAAALRSAVQNLVANAVKYGGTDRWVGIKAEQVREGRTPEVRITVSDHGPGIPANELPHIFDPFFRGGDAMAQQIHGNGLGLSLVKRIVNAHGGQVTVATKPGMGSAFTIALPAAEPDPTSSSVASSVRAAVHP